MSNSNSTGSPKKSNRIVCSFSLPNTSDTGQKLQEKIKNNMVVAIFTGEKLRREVTKT